MSKRNGLLAKVHIARKDMGLDDEMYRAMLADVLGVDSAADASDKQLGLMVAHFRRLGWEDKPPQRTFATPKETTRPAAKGGCDALMRKIGAYLADAKRPWSYAEALAKRICKIDRLAWCSADHLAKIIAALDHDAKRRARRAT